MEREFSGSLARGAAAAAPIPKRAAIALTAITLCLVSSSFDVGVAQQAALKRTVLRTIDFPPGFTTVTA